MNKRRAPGVRWVRPVLVTLLAVLMLVNVCVPGIYASAETVEKDYQYYSNAVTELETAAETDLTAEQASTYKAQADTLKTEIEAAAAATILDSTAATALQTRLDAVITAMDSKLSTAAVPAQEENADGNDGTDGTDEEADTNETPTVSEAAQSYLDQIAALQEEANGLNAEAADTQAKCADIYARLMDINTSVVEAKDNGTITEDEYTTAYNAIGGVVMTLYGYGYAPYAVSTLAESMSKQYYRSDCVVYWDSTNGSEGLNGANIQSVTLNNINVVQGNSNNGSGWDNDPSTVGTYYSSASTTQEQTVKLSITPADGYYVTRITVACAPGSTTPYKCSTWASGLAYDTAMTIGVGGTLTIDLSSVAFCHDNNNRENDHQYFILIQVAPLPSPLYVEYDYGDIVNILDNAVLEKTSFETPDGWTAVGSENNYYGSNTSEAGAQTEDTQYKYEYTANNEEDAAKWTHTSNSVTEQAKLAAANAGYYFTHWEAQYYEECTATKVTDPTYNNYTYTFSEAYGNPKTYGENEEVEMVTNVKLVAQWAPVKLNVKKTVAGLNSNQGTYTVQLKKDDANIGEAHNFTVTGSGTSDAWTISPITPGTYTIVETSPEIGSVVTENGTNKYLISTTYSEAVTVTADAIANGTYCEGTLTVTNTYSDATPALKLVKKWQDANGNALTETATANMPSVTFTVACTKHKFSKEVTLSYDAKDTTNYGWVKTLQATDLGLLDGCTIGDLTVTETVPTGYTLVGEIAKTSEEDTTNKTIYTVFTATNRLSTTKITLDKNVTGNLASYEDEFTFTVTVNDASTTYKLKHGTAPVEIVVPVGAKVEITETAVNGYTASATVDDNAATVTNTVTIESVAAKGHAVVFTNTKEAVIETGVDLNSFPFYVLISTAVVFAGILLVDKARYGKKF